MLFGVTYRTISPTTNAFTKNIFSMRPLSIPNQLTFDASSSGATAPTVPVPKKTLGPQKRKFADDPHAPRKLQAHKGKAMSLRLFSQLKDLIAKEEKIHLDPLNGGDKQLASFREKKRKEAIAPFIGPERYANIIGAFTFDLSFGIQMYHHAILNSREPKKPLSEEELKNYEEIKKLCKEASPYFKEEPDPTIFFQAELQEDKKEDFCRFIEKHPKFRTLFDETIKNEIKKEERHWAFAGLDYDGHVARVEEIRQECIEKNKFHGYFHPTGYGRSVAQDDPYLDTAHIDSYVMTPSGKIISLLPFGNKEKLIGLIPTMYTAGVDDFVEKVVSGDKSPERINPYTRNFAPQHSDYYCGTFGLLAETRYLKKNERELKQFTLTVTGEPGEKTHNHFFLSSPQLLFFSEQELFIKLTRAIVAADEDISEVSHKGEKYKVKTLRFMLNSGMKIEFMDGTEFSEKALATFRQRWLNILDSKVMPLWKQTGVKGPGGINYSIALTHKHETYMTMFSDANKVIDDPSDNESDYE